MKVSQLGEFGLIDLLAGLIEKSSKKGDAWSNLIVGIGDDAAVWRCRSETQIATVDALVEGVHFDLGRTSWQDLGWKSLAINVSDIAAMGGVPRYALVSLALSGQTDSEDVLSLYRGMLELAGRYDIAVVGGNISRAPIVTINITVLGEEGPSGVLLTRSGAKAADVIAVTGRLGGAAAGLRATTEGRTLHSSSFRQAFARPTPRVNEALILVENGVRAAIDLSDGLVSDLRHICRASGLGARIYLDDVPLAQGLKEEFPDQAIEWGLAGGEDYELLFAAPAPTVKTARGVLECPVTVVGQMIPDEEKRVVLVDREGNQVDLGHGGWDHFRRANHGF